MVGKREEEEEEEVVTREITEWRCGTIGFFFLLVCFDRGGITSENDSRERYCEDVEE